MDALIDKEIIATRILISGCYFLVDVGDNKWYNVIGEKYKRQC